MGTSGMKILLSAYACEPHKGSEPGLGWNWARTLARQGHDVHLLTRSNNRSFVEPAIAAQDLPIRTTYYDLAAPLRRWKRLPGGLQTYYLLWQAGAARVAKKLHAAEHFDCVHHVTFASFRQPSFMGRLGIPFLFGPVGGGETTPAALRQSLPAHSRRAEDLRDFANKLVAYDPLMRSTFARATVIGCTSPDTRAHIPARFAAKCHTQLAIGIDVPEREVLPESASADGPPTFLFVGRLIYWKGVHLALRALAEVIRSVPGARLKIVGQGEDAGWLRQIADQAGVAPHVDWAGWLPHAAMAEEYRTSAALVFPSFHDSGGMVVLEALAAGLPVICLKLGGPGTVVDSSCGVALDTAGLDEAQVVQGLAAAMLRFARDRAWREALCRGTLPRARQFTWEAAARQLYSTLHGVEEATAWPVLERAQEQQSESGSEVSNQEQPQVTNF